jgi:hypothetical protein
MIFVALLAGAGTVNGSGITAELVITAPGSVHFDHAIVLSAKQALNTSMGPTDRDGDGTISIGEADALVAWFARLMGEADGSDLAWDGLGPISHSSAYSHEGLVGPVQAVSTVTLRLQGTALFRPPVNRLSYLAWTTWVDRGDSYPATYHNLSVSLPPEWEIRGVNGVDFRHETPYAGGGTVTADTVGIQLRSPHEFPRDDWPTIVGASSITLVAAAVAAVRWTRKRRAAKSEAEAAAPTASPLDE